jgi:hypothetical protein
MGNSIFPDEWGKSEATAAFPINFEVQKVIFLETT